MRASQTFIATLRDDPGDAAVASHRLMIRSGLIRKLGAGLYHFLPLGLRAMRRVEQVIREEMNAAGALEFVLPILTPAEVWQQSGRWDAMGREMFRVRDRHDVWNLLGPTHEESFTLLMKELLQSYRDLPKNVYQIHTKFRDEIRPRFGVIRSREFVMKDAYSFDLDEAGLDRTYQAMRIAYRRIFARLGLDTTPVEADTGAMGGAASEEFMTPSEIGEEVLLLSESGSYRSNREKTPVLYPEAKRKGRSATKESEALERVHTPRLKSIEEVAAALGCATRNILKMAIFRAEQQLVAVAIRGDREVNEIKLKNHLGVGELAPAEASEISAAGVVPGFIGPHGLSTAIAVVWDRSLDGDEEWIVGANELDYHLKGYVPPAERASVDVALARAGDPSPDGAGPLKEMRGIELGHIFKLGYKYSRAFELSVLDENGRQVTPIMGCYGIGVNRTVAAIIEQWHDPKGIRWPISAAPYEAALISITRSQTELEQAAGLYQAMLAAGIDTLWDDRDLRPGVRFTDAELIGYPIRVTMGKGFFQNGEIEVQLRQSGQERKLKGDTASLAKQLLALRAELYSELERGVEEAMRV
ncbi:MAG: proline--tRNA ligase [Leptospirales bacterium]|nr:proline--tRNA ligase [Leptospirales bacterium]